MALQSRFPFERLKLQVSDWFASDLYFGNKKVRGKVEALCYEGKKQEISPISCMSKNDSREFQFLGYSTLF